jgi:hypothetical protein
MDLSGRFDFWRMLLHTRAITPPRVVRTLLSWWVLLGAAAATAAIVLGFGMRDPSPPSAATDARAVAASPAPAQSKLRW